MKEFYSKAIEKNISFWICLGISICLIITSFFVPPKGIIDPSVLASVGELFAFASLGAVIYAIRKGTSATVSHGNTTIEVKNEENSN